MFMKRSDTVIDDIPNQLRPRLEAAGWYAVRVQPGTTAKVWKKQVSLNSQDDFCCFATARVTCYRNCTIAFQQSLLQRWKKLKFGARPYFRFLEIVGMDDWPHYQGYGLASWSEAALFWRVLILRTISWNQMYDSMRPAAGLFLYTMSLERFHVGSRGSSYLPGKLLQSQPHSLSHLMILMQWQSADWLCVNSVFDWNNATGVCPAPSTRAWKILLKNAERTTHE